MTKLEMTILLDKILKEKRLCCLVKAYLKCTGCNAVICEECNKPVVYVQGKCNPELWHDWRMV